MEVYTINPATYERCIIVNVHEYFHPAKFSTEILIRTAANPVPKLSTNQQVKHVTTLNTILLYFKCPLYTNNLKAYKGLTILTFYTCGTSHYINLHKKYPSSHHFLQ